MTLPKETSVENLTPGARRALRGLSSVDERTAEQARASREDLYELWSAGTGKSRLASRTEYGGGKYWLTPLGRQYQERLAAIEMQGSIPVEAHEVLIEAGARAIYRDRPYHTAATKSAFQAGIMECVTFDFDGAPEFYKAECRELADTVLKAISAAAVVWKNRGAG